MIRLTLALVLFTCLASDASARCGARRTPIRTALSHLRPVNHPHLFPRLAAPAVVTGGCANGACANGVCPAPAPKQSPLSPLVPLKK